MKNYKTPFFKSDLWLITVCTICLQMPDLKISFIKLSEILMLLFLPVYFKDIFKSKTLIYFTLFYLLLLFKTFFFNTLTTFYINESLPLLKNAYYISLSRFIEMLVCITYTVFIFNAIRINNSPFELIKKFIFVQIFYCGLFYIFFFILYKIHLLHTTEYTSLIVYDTSMGDMVYRLKGFYVEGGPFGLFYAFIFTVCLAFYKKLEFNIWYLIIPVILVLMASSKAGYSMLSLTVVVYICLKLKFIYERMIGKIVIFIFAAISMIFFIKKANISYKTSLEEVEIHTAAFGQDEVDPNYMLGRISATVIVPNMLKFQLLQGIGWGNYPLQRNNPKYRLFMPELPVSMWDATGFGGMLDMLLEAGLIMFLTYILLYWRIATLITYHFEQSAYIMLAYVGPIILGGAIYLFYTWFLLGIILYFINEGEHELTGPSDAFVLSPASINNNV